MKSPPPRSASSNPSLSATTQTPALRDQRDQTELEKWKQGLIQPISRGLVFEQKQPSSALYEDGEPQLWQPEHPGTRERLLFLPRQPKSLRMDPKVLPKLLAWIDKNPNQLAQ